MKIGKPSSLETTYRSAAVGQACVKHNVGFAIENPEPWLDDNLWDIPALAHLAKRKGVKTTEFDQCRHGGEAVKPTRILHYKVDFTSLEGRCNHKPKWWSYSLPSGGTAWTFKPHLHMQRRKVKGKFASKALAAYPQWLRRSRPPSCVSLTGVLLRRALSV